MKPFIFFFFFFSNDWLEKRVPHWAVSFISCSYSHTSFHSSHCLDWWDAWCFEANSRNKPCFCLKDHDQISNTTTCCKSFVWNLPIFCSVARIQLMRQTVATNWAFRANTILLGWSCSGNWHDILLGWSCSGPVPFYTNKDYINFQASA